MDVEIRGVDDDVGPMLEGLELCPFGFDAVEEGALSLQRVGPPGRFESADEDLIGGFEIDDSQRQSLVEEVRDRLLQLRVLRASLGVDDDGDLRQGAIGPGDEFDQWS